MNLRRVVASLALDGGAYVRQLEMERDYYRIAFQNEQELGSHYRSAETSASRQAREAREQLTAAGQRFEERVKSVQNQAFDWEIAAEKACNERDAANRTVKLLAEQNEALATSNLELRASLRVVESAATSFRSANVELERQLEEEREQLAATTARAVARINALETENDELRARIEAPRDEQLDLLASPEAPEAKAEVVWEGVIEKVYQIAHVCFVDGHKWYFRDGGSEAFYAPIRDEEFNAQVARREVVFASGDAIRVRLHQVSTRKGDSYKTVSEVVKVLCILPPAPEQTTLLPEVSAAS